MLRVIGGEQLWSWSSAAALRWTSGAHPCGGDFGRDFTGIGRRLWPDRSSVTRRCAGQRCAIGIADQAQPLRHLSVTMRRSQKVTTVRDAAWTYIDVSIQQDRTLSRRWPAIADPLHREISTPHTLNSSMDSLRRAVAHEFATHSPQRQRGRARHRALILSLQDDRDTAGLARQARQW